MEKAAPASDLERRKMVRIRLRADLSIAPHKYEGRTYWVVKDPVSLRYYRFKEQEHFLLEFMDGSHTLDEAQKEFERRFRPDRLTLEDLESFAQQLLTAGLAQNESPQAGKQLFERRAKRVRSEWMQTLTNILYIKIPIFDPERLLQWMLQYVWWIFTPWFMLLSAGVMASAIMLVLTHFETFRSKLPELHEFFAFKNILLLWICLGVVKVIHEFGHGLSCRYYGGEVHEMGALFLCFSPCLYCNVSDAWTLPSKWQRITISAAGIYVELIIAAISTFVWWNSANHPVVKNVSLNLMVLCSISTVIFNANPLMRYDGYYVLADLIEVPNLRERCNRYIKNLCLEYCLGVEVQPEPYMALGRRIWFVLYASISYIYRWVITFSILYVMNNWLKPYKLGVVSSMLATFAAASMVGWPLYRLGKNIHKRGRLPDMKPLRVTISSLVIAGIVLFFFLVPLPISHIRQIGVVQVDPEAALPVSVQTAGQLVELKVRNGDRVRHGDILATFSNPQIEADLIRAEGDQDSLRDKVRYLETQHEAARTRPAEQGQIAAELEAARRDLNTVTQELRTKRAEADKLKLRASQAGVVLSPPLIDDVGRTWDKAEASVFCKVGDPERLRVIVPITPSEYRLLKEDMEYAQSKGEELTVDLRVQGLAGQRWQGKVLPLPAAAAREGDILPQLMNHHGGPVAVKQTSKHGLYVPVAQQYLIEIEIKDPGPTICPGALSQVKVNCRWRTTAWWAWHKVLDLFDLRLGLF
jgi:putative peptide zinc metalloprotease protein